MKTFVPGEIARASDVNANFTELSDRITNLPTELIHTARATTPNNWSQIQNPGNLTRIGHRVIFDGIGLAKVWNFEAGALNEFGKIIPSGFIPSSEVCAAGAVIQNWRAYPCLIGIRNNGTLYAISQSKVYLTKADIYNYLLIPAMSWEAAS